MTKYWLPLALTTMVLGDRWLSSLTMTSIWITVAFDNTAATQQWLESLLLSPHERFRTDLQLLRWRLQLRENKAIRSPNYDHCKFYTGSVLKEEDSTATVTECEGSLYGLVRVDGKDLVLEPANKRHVLRKRSVVYTEQPVVYNLTGDMVDDLEFDIDDVDVITLTNGTDEVDYFRDNNNMIVSRPLDGIKEFWIELAVIADHTMVKFHGRERVKHYILALMNIVSAIFSEPSLNANVTLVITKLFMYEEKDSVIKYGNVRKSLEAVNKWNYRHLAKLPYGSAWDAAVWLTRAPLGGPSGFAPVGGVCSRARSAALIRDEGLTSAFVIAHELAHLLGLTHDGAEQQCETAAHRGSIMAPTVFATLHEYAWSTCSRRQFHEKSMDWWCLFERSPNDGVEMGGVKELTKFVFTMDEQCRTEFGEGYGVCRSVGVGAACTRLWCAHRALPHVCRSKRAPPLDGTPCAPKHWCVDAVCEPMPGHTDSFEPKKSKAEWTDWSPWGECSTQCGYGLRTRTRRCSIRRSKYEEGCPGADTQISVCWAGIACAGVGDPRAAVCRRHSRRLLPYLHTNDSRSCEAWCVDYSGGLEKNFGLLPEATPCDYETPYNLCSQGVCVKGECNATDPGCDLCPDGYCNNNTHLYTKLINKGWSRIAVIPHLAFHVSIEVKTPNPLRIAVRERKRDKLIVELNNHVVNRRQNDDNYLRYDPSAPQNLQIVQVDNNVIEVGESRAKEGRLAIAGTMVVWKQTESNIIISTVSQLQADLMILASPEHTPTLGEFIVLEVIANYSSSSSRTRPLDYRWVTERGPCSASCGGGMRVVRTRCSPPTPAVPACPAPRYERCNAHPCEFRWVPGEWEHCSATCGDSGYQQRQIYCLPLNVTSSTIQELIRHSVSPALCSKEDMPLRVQPCNRLPCPVYWQEMPWTPCSTTCGRGVSTRPLTCPAENEMLCGPKPRVRRRRCRARRCPSPPQHLTPCPPADTTQYCELFTADQLQRNCLIPPFRKYCCNSCRAVDYGG